MKKYAFLILCFCTLSNLNAQKSTKEGWIVLNNGDTLFGKIHERDWNINPIKLDFENTQTINYKVADLKAFGLINGDTYIRETVTRHLLPNRDDAPYPDDENQIDTITAWLKIVIKGQFSLAALNTIDRYYFYVITPDQKVTELIYSKGLKNFFDDKYVMDPRYKKYGIIENPLYKNQLHNFFPEYNNLTILNNTQYSEASLEKFFRNADNTITGNNSNNKVVVSISAGLSTFTSKVSGDFVNSILYNSKFKNAYSPFIRFSLSIQSTRKRARVSFIPEIGFSTFNTTGTKTAPDWHSNFTIKNAFFETGILTRILFNPLSKQRLYTSLGINSYLKLSGENLFVTYYNIGSGVATSKEPVQHKFMIAPSISIGCLFSKFETFLNYQYLGEITSYTNNKWKVNRFSLGVSYFFKR